MLEDYSWQFRQVSTYPPRPLFGHSNLVRQYTLKYKKIAKIIENVGFFS